MPAPPLKPQYVLYNILRVSPGTQPALLHTWVDLHENGGQWLLATSPWETHICKSEAENRKSTWEVCQQSLEVKLPPPTRPPPHPPPMVRVTVVAAKEKQKQNTLRKLRFFFINTDWCKHSVCLNAAFHIQDRHSYLLNIVSKVPHYCIQFRFSV